MRGIRGFTLVELMIVVLIVGILTSIAVPGYRSYVLRVNRTDAKVGLTAAAQVLERCYTRDNTYIKPAASTCDPGLPYTVPREATAASATYTISATRLTASDFVLQATRANAQTDDADCGDFTLNAQGTKAVIGGVKTAGECWR